MAWLRQRQREIRRIDFFPVAEGRRVEAHLARLEQRLARVTAPPEPRIPRRRLEAFRGRRWVTRPRPYVDRLACIWFIRRFVRAEVAGVDAVLRGWHAAGWSDRVLEACGVALFDGLYRSLSARTAARRRARTGRPGG